MLRRMSDSKVLPTADAPPTLESDVPSESSAKPLADEGAPREMFGVPLDVFVKGGTTSARHDRHMQSMQEDARRRRAEADAEKKVARDHSYKLGNRDDVASLFSHEFTDHPEVQKAYVPLAYMSPNGKEVDCYGMADIFMPQDPKTQDELALMLFCPKCVERLPADQCIITVRQSNRYWELDRRKAGQIFIDPDGMPQHSAGEVMDSEKFHCPRCSWAACIDKNRVFTR
jgi:hypothetical protein